jgi:hypothetical protein
MLRKKKKKRSHSESKSEQLIKILNLYFILYVQFFFSIALHKRNYLQQSNQTKHKLSINHNLKFLNEILFFYF